MISDPELLTNVKPHRGKVTIANGEDVLIRGIGNLELFNKNTNALYIPEFASNLLSVQKATKDLDCLAVFSPDNVWFQDNKSGKTFGSGCVQDGLYVLDVLDKQSVGIAHSAMSTSSTSSIWHARLGHPHLKVLKLALPNLNLMDHGCEACILGKHCRTVYQDSSTVYNECFDLVHSDVWTAPCTSKDQYKYFVSFIDEKSKYTWVTLMSSKSNVLEAFSKFYNYVMTQFGVKIKTLRSDNGGEYINSKFKEFVSNHGIVHQTSCAYTPQQNGVAERKNRHLMEVARTMMFERNVPKRFWGDAVMTACYLINRLPTKNLENASPYEILHKAKPVIDHLRVFGCVCYVFVPEAQRNKLEPKSIKCMFIGYSPTQKGYKCYDVDTKRTYISREVKFDEEKGYFGNENWDELKDLASSNDRATILKHILDGLTTLAGPPMPPTNGAERHQEAPVVDEGGETRSDESSTQSEGEASSEKMDLPIDSGEWKSHLDDVVSYSLEDVVAEGAEETETGETEVVQPLRRSERLKSKNTRVYYNNEAVAHPIQAVCSLAHVPEEYQVFLGVLDREEIPRTYEEAIELKVWRDAVSDEKQAMVRNHTWDEADLPRKKKTVSSKWVFTIKYHSTGEIERHKARLVARGFTQTYGDDYRETFAPVAKLHTIRVVLSLAINLEWELWQMDVKNAFLQGELEEEVYMTPPPGVFVTPGKVLKLRKAIYGLKQSPRAWYRKLSITLLDRGFRRSEADHTLFTLQSQTGIIVILIYVDDIIISGNDKGGIQETKDHLKSVFDIKDLGELRYFLGIEVCRSKEGLFLSQRKYIRDLVSETGLTDARPARTPLKDAYKANQQGENEEDSLLEDAKLYRRLVGKLIYLTITRPDLCFAVNQASQYMQAPRLSHWKMVNRILRYIKGTLEQGIWMGCNGSSEIVGYCDADWAGDRVDRRSTTGYCTFVGGNLVTWKSKKQKVVACSSAEAEYRAMRRLTTELMWLKMLLTDLGIETSKPITMHCDNQSAIHIASNPVFHERTKHIEVDCHKVREQMELGVILPCYTRSSDQLADIFTKAASLKTCEFICEKMGLISLPSSESSK